MGTIITAAGEPQQVGNLVLPVGPSFFTTMQIPMLLGREIEERDQPGTPVVAVVNELFAKGAFGNDNPLGKHISLFGRPPRDLEIVGVSKTARYAELKSDNQPIVYIAYNQGAFGSVSQVTFELRTAGNPLNYVNSVREIVHQADARVPISNVKTQAAQVDQAADRDRPGQVQGGGRRGAGKLEGPARGRLAAAGAAGRAGRPDAGPVHQLVPHPGQPGARTRGAAAGAGAAGGRLRPVGRVAGQ